MPVTNCNHPTYRAGRLPSRPNHPPSHLPTLTPPPPVEMQQACQPRGPTEKRSRHLFLAGLRTVVDRRPTFADGRVATLQGHGCYPLINEDGLEDRVGGGQSCARPVSRGAGADNDNTGRLVPADKGIHAAGKATSPTSRGIS